MQFVNGIDPGVSKTQPLATFFHRSAVTVITTHLASQAFFKLEGATMAHGDYPFEAPQRPNRALRLIFSYKGSKPTLESRQEIEMTVPPSDRTYEYEQQSGFWVELRDLDDRVIYRRVMRNPMETEREAPSGDPKRPFTRVSPQNPQGTFAVLVPYVDSAEALVLCASPAGNPNQAAREVSRISIRVDLSSRIAS